MTIANEKTGRAWLGPRLGVSILVILACFIVSRGEAPARSGYFAERPPAHSFLGSIESATFSYMEKRIVPPRGAAANCRARVQVSTEPNYDFLKVYVAGVQVDLDPSIAGVQGLSGERFEQIVFPIPASPRGALVRFEYSKDGSVDAGRDTVRVFNLECWTSEGFFERGFLNQFTEVNTCPKNFVCGGSAAVAPNGWVETTHPRERSLSRPQTQYNANSTTTYAHKVVSFPSGNANFVQFVAYVSSQLGDDCLSSGDCLKFYIDGTLQDFDPTVAGVQSFSGNKRKMFRFPVTTAGSHTFKWEYSKDASTSAGSDIAKIDSVVFSSNHKIVGVIETDGMGVGSVPTGLSGTWVSSAPVSHRTYVKKQAAAPTINGNFNRKEYPNLSSTMLLNTGVRTQRSASLGLLESTGNNSLYVLLVLPGSSAALGAESGTISLYLDANRIDTEKGVGGTGCSSRPRDPANEDRRIVLSYRSAAGVSANTVSVAQSKGACSASYWTAPAAGELWTVTSAIVEPASHPGTLIAEIKITLAGDVLSTDKLGLGIVAQSSSGFLNTLKFPTAENATPLYNDVSTWETVDFNWTGVDELSESFPAHRTLPGDIHPHSPL